MWRSLSVDQVHSLNRPSVKAAAPFVAVATVGLVSALLPPYEDHRGEPILVVASFAVTLGLVWVSTHRDRRTWVDPAGPLLFFGVLMLARDMTGGASSGLTPLVVLPIVWLAMTGTRRDLVGAALMTAVIFLVPIVAIGAPHYPLSGWRPALLWTAFAAVVAPVIQRMVRQLASETDKARETAAELDGIMSGARLSSMISTDLHGTIRSFSPGAEELLGYPADEVVGRVGHGLLHDPTEIADVARELGVEPGFAVFRELARTNAPSRVWTFVRADREEIFVRLAITDLRDAEDTVVGYLGVAIDATQSVRAERALAVAEARWRVLMDHLPDITVLTVDEQLTIGVVAGAGAMRQGLQGREGQPLSSFSNPSNLATFRRLVAEAGEGREGKAELRSTRTRDEHEVVVTPLPDEGDHRQALILARDVSKDRAREREILEAKERAERLFTDAPHGVAVLRTDGTVLQINEAMVALIGASHEAMVGAHLGDLSSDGTDELTEHLADALTHRGERVESTWTILNRRGETLHLTVSSRVLPGGVGADDVVLANFVDVSDRHRYELRLAHLADHDALTGLANRRRFGEELARHFDHCERYGPVGAVLLLDLDHFKEVNDTLGHNAGDELIVSTASLLLSGVRGTDIVARLGGDEFAILLPRADHDAAATVAEGIVSRIREFTRTLDGTRRRVTASVGVVTFAAASQQGEDILALADMTMYDAKDAGRDGYAVLDETSGRQPRTGARLRWKSRIEQAIENDAFTLHLQPILDLRSNRIHSAEVLLRLDDGDDLVMPNRFLYVAERTGLITSIDTWVIEHSVRLLKRLQQLDPTFALEVNLSGLSIGHPEIERTIVDSLFRHRVDPSTLILEITETAAVADVETARAFAERMTTLGCQFALDDFGAGFGSFYYLKHLLFDYVKIDGEFITNCHRSSIDRSILRSVVGIAHDLGKKAIAEFVADPDHLDVVRSEGVDLAQGYLIGEPVPYDEFVERHLAPPVGATPTP